MHMYSSILAKWACKSFLFDRKFFFYFDQKIMEIMPIYSSTIGQMCMSPQYMLSVSFC